MTGSLFSFFLLNFCTHTVCLSKDVTGHCTFTTVFYQVPPFYLLLDLTLTQCICPKTWQVTVASTALLHQVPFLIWLLSFLSFYLFVFTQCICPKTWQVAVLPTPASVYTVYLSKDVTGALLPPPPFFFVCRFLSPSPLSYYLVRISLLPFLTLWSDSTLCTLFSCFLFLSLLYGFICPKTWQVLPPPLSYLDLLVIPLIHTA